MDNVDTSLREAIKILKVDEILVLKGDRPNSLIPRSDPKKIHDNLMTQHLSCFILPYGKLSQKIQEQVPFVKRYLALYLLYKVEVNKYTITDDVVKTFYF